MLDFTKVGFLPLPFLPYASQIAVLGTAEEPALSPAARGGIVGGVGGALAGTTPLLTHALQESDVRLPQILSRLASWARRHPVRAGGLGAALTGAGALGGALLGREYLD